MKNTILSHKAFTLLEVLVVLVIAGLLMALALPAIRGAVGTAQRAQVLSNMKQLYTVVVTRSAGSENLWPSTNAFNSWITTLPPYISTNDVKSIFSGGGIKVTEFPPNKSAITIYQVREFSNDDYIFGSSANWNASSPGDPGENTPPFGRSGIVFITKGGRGGNASIKDITNSVVESQPAPMTGIPAP